MAAYSFDASDATDDSGNGHNGSLILSPTFPTGHTNSGVGFDGTSGQYVEIADHADFTFTNAWTVMTWVKFNSLLNASIVPKQDQWWFGYDTTTGKFTHGFYLSGGGTSSTLSDSAPNTGQWYHAAARYDGSTLDIVLDGTPASSPTLITNTMIDSANPVRFGSWNGSSEFLDGVVDDVRIFNSFLTTAEVTTYMNTPVAPAAGGTAELRPFPISSGLRW